MNFDEIIDRRGTHSSKWDAMTAATGVDAPDAIAMWVADMDFRAPDFLQEATQGLLDKANYGYFTGEAELKQSIAWWMNERHGWAVDPSWVTSAISIGQAIAMCLQIYTDPGDEVIIFTPVYHEFTVKINLQNRIPHMVPLAIQNGVYEMDFDALEAGMTGREKAVLFCSPHNPAGRIWTPAELQKLAAFCEKHDLLFISDEIHHDLVYPGQTFTPTAVAVPDIAHRLITLTAASKTFNIAGARQGSVTIEDPKLRETFAKAQYAHQIAPNMLGVALTQAAYSERGAAYVDELTTYIDANHRLFLDGMAQIPGLTAMPMQSTYLAWVDFTNTGMDMDEAIRRVKTDARVAPSVGAEFGKGGESFLRFNIGTARPRLKDAIARIQDAFSDLQ